MNALPAALLVVAGTALLLIPALDNGYPLVFMDTGFYLRGALGLMELYPGRTAGYPLLLRPWLVAGSTWPAIVFQAAATSVLVVRASWVLAPRRPMLAASCAILAVGLLSGAGKYASWLMPDITTGWLFLAAALWLRAQRKSDRILACLTLAVASLTHNTHPPLLLGLSMLALAASCTPPGAGLRRRAAGLLGLAALTLPLGLAVNVATGRGAQLFFGGDAFLVNRFTDTGVMNATLDAYCPERDWVSCRHRDAFREHTGKDDDWFMWGRDTPFRELEWAWDEPRELRRAAFRCCWGEILETSLAGAWSQFWRIGSGDGVTQRTGKPTPAVLERALPGDLDSFRRARQWSGRTPRFTLHGLPEVPLHAALLLLAGTLAIASVRRGRADLAAVVVGVFLFLVGNAVLCSFASTVNDRYQGRIAWLVPWCIALLAVELASSGRETSEPEDA